MTALVTAGLLAGASDPGPRGVAARVVVVGAAVVVAVVFGIAAGMAVGGGW